VAAEALGHHQVKQAGLFERLDYLVGNPALGFSPRGILLKEGPQTCGASDEFLFVMHFWMSASVRSESLKLRAVCL